tara:strand:+ start:71 stop:325 length:255 start_codon:yes stop_codon:yes gene_type:complete
MDIRQTPAYETLIRAHHLLERAYIGLTRPDGDLRRCLEGEEKGAPSYHIGRIASDISRAMALVADRIPCDWCGDPQIDCDCDCY